MNQKSRIWLVQCSDNFQVRSKPNHLPQHDQEGKDEATFLVQREHDHRHRGGRRGCDEGCRISSSGKTAAAIKNNEQWDTLPVPL